MYYLKLGTLTPSPGIYVQDTDGYCLTADEWNRRMDITPANGIAVVLESHSFVMALEFISSVAPGGDGIWIDGVPVQPFESNAIQDFDGYSNTQAFIEKLSGVTDDYGVTGSPAAETCVNYTFPNGKKGYWGAAGEMNAIKENFTAINVALSACGLDEIKSYQSFWTSTQAGAENPQIWILYAGTGLVVANRDALSSVIPLTTL